MLKDEHSDEPWHQSNVYHREILAHEVWTLFINVLFEPLQLVLNLNGYLLLLLQVLPDKDTIEQWHKSAVEVVNDPAT